MRTNTLHTRLFGVLLLSASMACGTTPDTDEAPQPSDPMITAHVQSSYFTDSTVKGRNIDVSTSQGVVTLEGTVESQDEKARAVELARETDGVVDVRDQLMVAAPAPEAGEMADADSTDVNETRIATEIEAQFFVDPDVKGRNIDVRTAPDGTVTLLGVVDTAETREKAVSIARNTSGVTNVQDELVMSADLPDANEPEMGVDVDAATNDAWITTKIQARYFMDTDVKGRNIDVTTNAGEVSLTGTVESAAEKREAVALARNIEGVTNVRDNLQVVPDEDADMARMDDDSESPVEDTWVTTKIQAQYFADPDVSGLEVDVTTVNGVVTLSGSVDSDTEKTLAEEIARETEGVRRVENRLTVGAETGD